MLLLLKFCKKNYCGDQYPKKEIPQGSTLHPLIEVFRGSKLYNSAMRIEEQPDPFCSRCLERQPNLKIICNIQKLLGVPQAATTSPLLSRYITFSKQFQF
jgi:hypothetical protein